MTKAQQIVPTPFYPCDSDELNKRWTEEAEKAKGPDGKLTGIQAYKALRKAIESVDDRD